MSAFFFRGEPYIPNPTFMHRLPCRGPFCNPNPSPAPLSFSPPFSLPPTAITDNAELFAGKRVLDVGTGSGILALWAAKAGATKVGH